MYCIVEINSSSLPIVIRWNSVGGCLGCRCFFRFECFCFCQSFAWFGGGRCFDGGQPIHLVFNPRVQLVEVLGPQQVFGDFVAAFDDVVVVHVVRLATTRGRGCRWGSLCFTSDQQRRKQGSVGVLDLSEKWQACNQGKHFKVLTLPLFPLGIQFYLVALFRRWIWCPNGVALLYAEWNWRRTFPAKSRGR